MTTTETINGQPIKIKWEFKEKLEWLNAYTVNYRLLGVGSNSKTYNATILADYKDPKNYNSGKVENIEEM